MATELESISIALSTKDLTLLRKYVGEGTPGWRAVRRARKTKTGARLFCSEKEFQSLLKPLRNKTGAGALVYKMLMAKIGARPKRRKRSIVNGSMSR